MDDAATPGSEILPSGGKPTAGKNIVIFSDGTGQRGGVYFDEARTNIYKLYRATRVAPDTCINPAQQVAFYDPGLGTQSTDGSTLSRIYRTVYNFVSQATGLGITKNIIDCYAAAIELWRPGDRIYVFGFSRGAYTVRCLASVLCLCGIPSQNRDGSPLKRDSASAKKVAAEAVKKVYQHVSSPRDRQYLEQRTELAEQFRARYGCSKHPESEVPYFIGVFDTVAALSNRGSLTILAALTAAAIFLASFGLDLLFPGSGFSYWLSWLVFDAFVATMLAYVYTHLKLSFRLERARWWETVHLTPLRQRFYDDHLDVRVGYARHALSIDERRADFDRVKWSNHNSEWETKGVIDRFQQKWFAGNHADIGGGYPENESRLSDIALSWMVEETQKLEQEKLLIDNTVLRLNPSVDGKQHDETRNILFRLAGKSDRKLVVDATLHDSVEERMKENGVLQYDVTALYRPESLRTHTGFAHYYEKVARRHTTCWQRLKSAWEKWRSKSDTPAKVAKVQTDISGDSGEGVMDKAASCIGLLVLFIGVLIFVGVLGFYQAGGWLVSGVWHPVPLSVAASWLKALIPDWVGLQLIVDWTLKLPLSLVSLIAGVGLFWGFGSLSAKLHQMKVDGDGLVSTPSQKQA